MRKYWIIGGSIVGGLLALGVLAVLVVPNLIPQEVYRAEIEKVAYQVTGRKVSVTGRIEVAVFPRIEARAGASTIANPQGFEGTNFASMKELRAAVALWPLFSGKVEVEEFVDHLVPDFFFGLDAGEHAVDVARVRARRFVLDDVRHEARQLDRVFLIFKQL